MPGRQISVLNYGANSVPVQPSNELPLPERFDFDNPIDCAKQIFAIMVEANGGFPLDRCKLHYDLVTRSANLTANGCHVYYAREHSSKMTVPEVIEMMERSTTVLLGTVSISRGRTWREATWN